MTEEQLERCYLRRIILFALLAALIVGPVLVYSGMAHAAPRYVANVEGVTITLFDEPCSLDAVENLPYKATWTENGVTFQGCWNFFQNAGVIVGYFSDKSVAPMPVQIFKPLSNG